MDSFFNKDVADWITKSMSRMDPDEAEMFAQFFVYEVHKQDIENNRRTLDRHVEEVTKSLLDDLSPEDREIVSKVLISKDFDTPWEKEFHQTQPRGKDGKWRKIKFSGPSFEFGSGKSKVDVTSALNRTGKAGTAFADRWTERGPNDASTNERTYRRVEAGAKLLGNIPGKHAQAASAVGQFAGQFGPEAEKVIGPTARRTAYRYRGTERNPDARLLGFVKQQEGTELKRLNSDADFRRRGGADNLTPEQKMAVSEDAAAAYLYSRLPKKSLASLQRASGKLPPSEGVIINRDGEIVTQSVGYNEDHYLPFNLKNLKGLKGGSYVRTRSTGGLTSEDIYTGLVAGARSITVVSRSGVFTLDFEDDLRGGRRYSDKARQMVGRYAQTLDAVQSKQVARRGLTPDEKAEIRDEVEAETDGMGYKAHEVEAMIKEREQEYSRQPHLTSAELDSVKRKALEATESYKGAKTEGTERMPDDPKKRYKIYYGQFMDELMEDKAKRMYQLDADGYDAAQQALREQFPYFVADVRVKRVPGEDKSEDAGYVRPNYIRPKAVRAGYFDEEINGRGKFAASELHYQNYSHGRSGQPAADGATASTGATKTAEPKKLNLAEAKAMGNAQKLHREALKQAADAGASIIGTDPDNNREWKHLSAYRSNPDSLSTMSAQGIQDLIKDLNSLKLKVDAGGTEADKAVLAQHLKVLDDTDRQMKGSELLDRANFDPGVVSKYPQRFSEQPWHTRGNPSHVYTQAYDKIAQHARVERVPATPTDEQLQAIQQGYADVHSASKAFAKNPSDSAAQLKFMSTLGSQNFPEPAILKARDAALAGDTRGVELLAQETGNKATAVFELRSILQAAGGKLDRSGGEASADTVTSEVVRSNIPEQELHKRVRAMIPNMPNKGLQRGVEELANALEFGDKRSVEEALENLPEDIANPIRREMRGQ